MQTYNKLVRDKIPAIIAADHKICDTEILNDAEYIKMLDEKLIEELSEYQESKEIEELADMLEVMYAIAKSRGVSISDLESIRADKALKRGGFEDKIFLNSVTEK